MLAGNGAGAADLKAAMDKFKGTSVYESLTAAAKKRSVIPGGNHGPSYMSAKAFADAVVEGIVDDDGTLTAAIPAGLKKRLTPIVRESEADLQHIKAGLERWFDDTMERVGGAYKRWASVALVAVGLFVAVSANASTYDTAVQLWRQPVTREAVADAAGNVVGKGEAGTEIKSVADATKNLDGSGLPVGWTPEARRTWREAGLLPWNWAWAQWATVLGWLVTALLVSLGAPFWFDLLSKLVALRSSGAKPPTATEDPGSATKNPTPPPPTAPAAAHEGILGTLASLVASQSAAPPATPPGTAASPRPPVDLTSALTTALSVQPPRPSPNT
jgi:hypothetical protein